MDLADGVNDIVVDPLGVFRPDADLDETVEDLQRTPAAFGAIFNFLALWAAE
jgi:hypothetical protein